MQRALRLIGVSLLAAFAASRAAAQDFVPPDRGRTTPPPGAAAPRPSGESEARFQLGVFGFSTRGGWQVNKGGQGVIGAAVDVAQLGSPLVRLRPSVEFGIGNSFTSIGANLEVVYRFQPDQAPAIPYLGLGVGYYDDRLGSKNAWPTVVMGFELPLKRSFNWLIEYHALDTLRRSRFLVGLSTRGAN